MNNKTENALLEEFKRGRQASLPKGAKSHQRDALVKPARVSLYEARLAIAEAHFSQTSQAVFKVMSFAQGQGQVNNILYYISQEGTLSLEDETGARWREAEAKTLSEEWAIDYGHRKAQAPKTKFSIENPEQNIDSLFAQVKTQLAESNVSVRYSVSKARTLKAKITVLFDAELTPREIDNLHVRLCAKLGDHTQVENTSTIPQAQRDAVHLLFSSPKGTPVSVVRDATREYLAQHFADYRYFFATHKDDFNHVHVVMKMVDNAGKRLTLSKAKLMEIRRGYANVARGHGMAVHASYRSERGVGQKGDKGKVRQLRDRLDREGRGEQPEVDQGRASRALDRFNRGDIDRLEIWEIKALQKNQQERDIYREAAAYYQDTANQEVDGEKKRALIAKAAVLNKMAKEMPVPQSREQKTVQHLSVESLQRQRTRRVSRKENDVDLSRKR